MFCTGRYEKLDFKRKLLLFALIAFALPTFPSSSAATDVCVSGDNEQGMCTASNDGHSFEKICRDSFGSIHEVAQLAQSDALAFVSRAWEWIELASKCVYAIDTLKLPSLAAYSASNLQGHIVSILRSVMSLDKEPLNLPAGACKKLIWKKKTFTNIFHATVTGGGLHPQISIKEFVHNVTSYDGLVTDQVLRSRGVYSSVDIPKGTAISFVPAARIMHRSEFNRSKIWTSLARLSPDPTNHTRTVDLSVVVAYELNNSRSYWLPYLCNLPTAYQGSALTWGREKLRATGDPDLEHSVNEFTKGLVTTMSTILPALEFRVAPKNYVWAFLATISRAFNSKPRGWEPGMPLLIEPVLAPVMDLFNHHANPHVQVDTDLLNAGVETGMGKQPGITMSAIRDIKAGEEIYNFYDSHCAREWVLMYGFVPSEGLLPLSSCR